jgi:2'-hydroxyisoflavone reductase
LIGDRNGDLKALVGREWDVCIDNPTTLPAWVRDAGHVLKGRVKHYVFISTISVYAKNDTPGADETAAVLDYPGPDPYAETLEAVRARPILYGQLKAVSEHEARRQFGEAAVTVIRPGLIVGPGDETDRFTYWPVRLANDGHRFGDSVLAPPADDPVQFIDARDLAEWTIRMAEQRRSGTYNATGPARLLTMDGMLVRIAAAARVNPDIAWAPLTFLEDNHVAPWSDLPVWIPPAGDSAGFTRRSIARARAAGLKFRPLDLTAADTLAWFRGQPPDRQAKLRAGLTPEREAELVKKLRA